MIRRMATGDKNGLMAGAMKGSTQMESSMDGVGIETSMESRLRACGRKVKK